VYGNGIGSSRAQRLQAQPGIEEVFLEFAEAQPLDDRRRLVKDRLDAPVIHNAAECVFVPPEAATAVTLEADIEELAVTGLLDAECRKRLRHFRIPVPRHDAVLKLPRWGKPSHVADADLRSPFGVEDGPARIAAKLDEPYERARGVMRHEIEFHGIIAADAGRVTDGGRHARSIAGAERIVVGDV